MAAHADEDAHAWVAGLRWSPVAVLAAGPSADLAASSSALGGAGASLNDASAIVDDSRMHVSASGICFVEASGSHPPVVLTCAAVVAPFLAHRASLPQHSLPKGTHRRLHPAVDVAVVPTTELFVIFSEDEAERVHHRPGNGRVDAGPAGGADGVGGGSVSSDIVASPAGPEALESYLHCHCSPASIAACVPIPSVEEAFARLQGASASGSSSSSQTSRRNPRHQVWQAPAVGSLGVAILHVSTEEGSLPARVPGEPIGRAGIDFLATQVFGKGCPVRICSSPFGALKPSLFLNSEVRGAIAGGSADDGLLLLDGRCLPGSEGGAVVLDDGSDPVPIAFVVPPLHMASSSNTLIGAAVSLRSAGRALSQSLPAGVLRALLGAGACHLLCPAAAPIMQSLSSERDIIRTSAIAAQKAVPSLCSITFPESDKMAAVGVVISNRGHMLTSAAFVAALVEQQLPNSPPDLPRPLGLSLRCKASPLDENIAAARTQEAIVLHIFEGVPDAALVLLQTGVAPPLPWCLPESGPPSEAHLAIDALHEGAEVLSLALKADTEGAPVFASGIISQVVGPSQNEAVQSALVLESSFPAPPGEGAVLIHPGPPASFMGLTLSGTWISSSGRVLPHQCLGLVASHLLPLLQVLQASDAESTGRLVELDKFWQRCAKAGPAQLLWQLQCASSWPESLGKADLEAQSIRRPPWAGKIGTRTQAAL